MRHQENIFFLFLNENICCGYSLEAPRWGASNEYHNICFHEEIKISTFFGWKKGVLSGTVVWVSYLMDCVLYSVKRGFVARANSKALNSLCIRVVGWVTSLFAQENVHTVFILNIYNVEPDQTLKNMASELDLHCLPMPLFWGYGRH